MARTTASVTLDLEEDKPYKGTLRKPEGTGIVKGWFSKGNEEYGTDLRLTIDWELNLDAGRVRDWVAIKLGDNVSTGKPSKLRQMLNALAEKPPETEVWFDDETLEWGYNMDDPKSAAYARLTEGMEVMFKGEYRKNQKGGRRYAITGYKRYMASAGKNRQIVDNPEPPIDVDPDEIPF